MRKTKFLIQGSNLRSFTEREINYFNRILLASLQAYQSSDKIIFYNPSRLTAVEKQREIKRAVNEI